MQAEAIMIGIIIGVPVMTFVAVKGWEDWVLPRLGRHRERPE